jgi:hypothetical protein
MLRRACADTTTLYAVSFLSALVRWKRLAFALLLSGLFVCPPARSHAAGLQCPELTLGAMSNPLADPKRAQLVTTGNSTDLANEIYDLINRLQTERSNISYTELTNVLIAAYCPVVSNAPQLTEAEKWQRMRQFDAVLRQQLSAAETMPAGSLIIANIALPPAVYRELRSQAADVNQSPAQLMAAILTKAAGR